MKKFIIFYVSVSLVFSFNVSANAKTKYIKIKGNISHNLTYSPKKAIKVLKKLKVKNLMAKILIKT
jgi:hypothetical protein